MLVSETGLGMAESFPHIPRRYANACATEMGCRIFLQCATSKRKCTIHPQRLTRSLGPFLNVGFRISVQKNYLVFHPLLLLLSGVSFSFCLSDLPFL